MAEAGETKEGPVYLSKYLADGKIKDAQDASSVVLPHSSVDLESWSGYITVNVERGDHLFIWYIPQDKKIKKVEKSPLMIWLSGGPGFSSLLGLFEEMGPFVVGENKVSRREVSWTDHFSLLFIDNPVGAGFSYRESGDEESISTDEAVDSLYQCVSQFFEIFPQVKTQELYIGGQSYAGKYVPPLAYRLHSEASPDINLKGIYIAAGLMSPKKMLPLSPDILVNLGVISKYSGEIMRSSIKKSMEEMKTEPKKGMKNCLESIFEFMKSVKGYPCLENMISTKDYHWRFESYLNLPEVQQAIHVMTSLFKTINEKTVFQMAPDFRRGVSHEMSVLMDNNYRVLLFNGQMDPVLSVIMTDAFLSDLRWSGREAFLRSVKRLWKDASGDVAGYVTSVKDFTWLIISRAGHRTVIDRPQQVLDMMLQFVHDVPM